MSYGRMLLTGGRLLNIVSFVCKTLYLAMYACYFKEYSLLISDESFYYTLCKLCETT